MESFTGNQSLTTTLKNLISQFPVTAASRSIFFALLSLLYCFFYGVGKLRKNHCLQLPVQCYLPRQTDTQSIEYSQLLHTKALKESSTKLVQVAANEQRFHVVLCFPPLSHCRHAYMSQGQTDIDG